MPRQAIATVLVGPSALLREGLARILCPPKFRVIASGRSLGELKLRATTTHEARLLVIEFLDIPAELIEAITLFKQQNPTGRVAVLGRHCRPSDIVAALQAGANVYLAEVVASDEVVKALEVVMMGQTILPMELLSWVSDSKRNRFHLSERENGILSCIARGDSNKIIARKIKISEATVKVHVKTILRKIGVSNRTQAAIWAMNKYTATPLASSLSPGWQSVGTEATFPNGHEISAVSQVVVPRESVTS
jgi:DNA-binding NarL/FixJ family response regulator